MGYRCAICLTLSCEPVKLQCSHLFCKLCIERTFETSKERVCPMCRAEVTKDFVMKIDKEAREEAKQSNPDEYEEVLKNLNKLKLEEKKILKIKIKYGNRHKLAERPTNYHKNRSVKNKHIWTAFIEVIHPRVKDTDLIEKVKFELHETFKNPTRFVTKAPFKFTINGWGEFELPMTITWKKHLKMPPTTFYHDLCFDDGGKWHEYVFRIHEDLIKPKTSASKVKVKAVKPAPFK
ncbi:unnamed protein product [Moneuplotes crassus]|uniref:RING-type domain-containing protein n=1 Tax=Euplotes crassus TaxID=5936 RepID=A0AAD2CXM8_EUPCR|nr:unnamed protein product [Moneuplotes crassus]